jgi:ADP-heptose:LPS heptosyltransferase
MTSSFAQLSRSAKKLLVLDLGFLGDTVHLLPSLWAIRNAWPEAELHVMVAEHVTQLLQVTPWIQTVWGYPRFPKGPKPWQDFGRIRKLRDAQFDAVINLNGSDRSSLLTWLSGARWRLGRRPEDGGPWHWAYQFTHVVEVPYRTGPVWKQRWNCLKKAGIPVEGEGEFRVTISEAPRRAAGIGPEDDGHYFHISPFTTQDRKELPQSQLAGLVRGLLERFPEKRVVVSCAPNERERGKLAALLAVLPVAPWRVFDGTLRLLDLASVIAGSAVHFGGDSGAVHLALMAGTPSVSWFRQYEGLSDWAPNGRQHRVLVGQEAAGGGIEGIGAGDLLDAAAELLAL